MVLNGSPRKEGNTSLLVEAFKTGAESVGNEVRVFSVNDMKIRGCQGCHNGGKDITSPCAQKDDMDQIYSIYNETDVIVFASPLFYWMVTSQLKTALDRLFATEECDPNLMNHKKETALLVVAEGDGFDSVLNYYRDMTKRMEWKNLGEVFVSGVGAAGDIKGNPKLEEAKKLGASI